MAQHNILGKEGEEQAVAFLRNRQYTILHTNWRWRRIELDIIARKDDEIVIIEVKSRSANCPVPPETAVTPAKIKRLVSAADVYVRYFDLDLPVRFDIISVIKERNGEYRIEHIDNAFYAPGW